jgi:pSer/pThr/pTyr-binding forkhead associated (FHA) protein
MAANVKLRIQDGDMAGKEFVFTHTGRCTVGRADDCDLRLPTDMEHISISRHHCMLRIVPPRLWVRDLRSRNGTRINGMQIGHPATWPSLHQKALAPLPMYELHDGDTLDLSGMVLKVSAKHPEDRPVHLVDVEGDDATCAMAPWDRDAELAESPMAVST